MTSFNDRERAFEEKYRMDEELLFKVTSRRNRLLGEWVAGKMGLSGDEAKSYAKEVVASDFDEPGDHDVLRKVMKDLNARGLAVPETEVRQEMDRLLHVARDQIVGTE